MLESLPNNRPYNFLRLGIHAERKYFEKENNLFTGVALNGTTVALTPEPTGILLNFSIRPPKPFFVDPLTYVFACEPKYVKKEDGKDIKRSIKKMVNFFGEPLSKIAGKKALSPDELKDKKTMEWFCARVLSFQKEPLSVALSEDMKYLEQIEGALPISQMSKPFAVIAPYFYLDIASWEYWINPNLEFIQIALEQEREIPVFGEIVLERIILQEPKILDEIAERYNSTNSIGFFIWVSNFPEYEATTDEIISLRKFIKKLSSKNHVIINLYGGYLSALLFFDGLKGFCHGPGYGENRHILPVGGGLPNPTYYFPPLHRRIPTAQIDLFRAQSRISHLDFYSTICRCPTCAGVIQDSIENFDQFGQTAQAFRKDGKPFSYVTGEAKELNSFHYLYVRQNEILDIQNLEKEGLLTKLQDAERMYSQFFSREMVSHLMVWHEALSKVI
jgi:hypothetical protein